MKKYIFPLTIIFSLLIFCFSCSSKPKRSRKPVSSITILPAAQNYIFGTSVSVRVETKLRNGEIDNIRLFYQGELIHESRELDFTVSNILLNHTGDNNFQVVATKKDNVNNSQNVSLNVVSDIIPEKFKYNVINDFPHNPKLFTQGLEYHNGYIYEGTGEYGTSGLYQVNLHTGKILKEQPLNKKYFGEGITILNNKIYQLTYRSQKGFVYDLENFAVIDSFTFRSKEGWGLTNDGENLIMSNGTHELIWINPSDFSQIKKVQVANNEGVINYLNELEYINGTIYANVYTTNLIVQIDPETGKVLSEINFDGILNMYANPDEPVDYMNGIAYDQEKNRLFVTGKYWPRIFEIQPVKSE